MKLELNRAIAGKTIGEIILFREMANLFNTNISKCTYVDEVHGKRGMIEFSSNYLLANKKVEISDLLLLTFDRHTTQLRVCFLQAKYRHGKINKFFNFNANIFQWELLLNRPTITSTRFPNNILNFRNDYDSITAYGIFYHDITSSIDFLYTIPGHINPSRRIIIPTAKGIRAYRFNQKCTMPNSSCTSGILPNEIISTCSVDTFEKQVLKCKIGAPITLSITPYIISLLNSMRSSAHDSSIIDELLNYIDSNNEYFNETITHDYNPAALIVITDSSLIDDVTATNC